MPIVLIVGQKDCHGFKTNLSHITNPGLLKVLER